MSKANQKNGSNPVALLNMAREYYLTAEELAVSKSNRKNVRHFLYFHAGELLLKAYLGARGVKAKGHRISELYKECCQAGLTIDSEDSHDVFNIVSLLESGNKNMGFRYFTMKSGSIPEMCWTSEVVGHLKEAVTAVLDPDGNSVKPGPPIKAIFIFGRPVPKDKRTPVINRGFLRINELSFFEVNDTA